MWDPKLKKLQEGVYLGTHTLLRDDVSGDMTIMVVVRHGALDGVKVKESVLDGDEVVVKLHDKEGVIDALRRKHGCLAGKLEVWYKKTELMEFKVDDMYVRMGLGSYL